MKSEKQSTSSTASNACVAQAPEGPGASERLSLLSQGARALLSLVIFSLAPLSSRGAMVGDSLSEWDLSGYIESEVRIFPQTPADTRQFQHLDASLALEPEIYRRWEESLITFTLKPFLRLDLQDEERTHFDLRETMFTKSADRWDLRAGVGKVFWGVTESQHLVDTVNQTDFVENLDGEEKLGQPMVNLAWITEWAGTFSMFYLPYFRERTFPDAEGRLRTMPHVDTDNPIYESDLGEWHPDVALRWSQSLGEFDLGIHYFRGTSRDPLYSPKQTSNGRGVLQPVYNLMDQCGLDVQWTHESWLWKLEAIAREGKGQHYQAFVGGYEYTFYGVFGSTADVGVLSEYHYDSRGEKSSNLFNNDIFTGTRLALNDSQDTTLLAGAVIDHETGSSSARLEFERRLGNRYMLEVEGQWFLHSDASDPVYSFQRDSFISIALQRYF